MEQGTPITPPRGRLLLIEDDAAIRRLITTALTDEGYEAVAAQDGATALALVGPPGAWRPDLILLDLSMPGMDGRAFAATYRDTAGPHAPIVLLTALSGGEAAAAIEGVGAVGLLGKPFDVEVLLELVQKNTVRPGRSAANGVLREPPGDDVRE